MAYSELIKNFERIRDYMREFYVFGFKSRDEYSSKSARSYDNERRRVESWLGDYMSFRQDSTGKNVFISVDSQRIITNPFYKAFKTKSFTDYDIILHFYILDILSEREDISTHEIIEAINEEYLGKIESDILLDDSTIRKKLNEYEQEGIVVSKKSGREKLYSLNTANIDEESWRDAIAFMSEEDPIGVIGSYCLDRFNSIPNYLTHKHHYILGALDSQILFDLLIAIKEQRAVELTIKTRRMEDERFHTVFPVKIYSSTQSGRRYALAYEYKFKKFIFFRLDSIHKVKAGSVEKKAKTYYDLYEKYKRNLWGVSVGRNLGGDHIEMTVHVDIGEDHIVRRLEREKRGGTIEKIDESTYRFSADVYDALEMLPWIRTFIGRIVNLSSTNNTVIERYNQDLEKMKEMYGGRCV